MAVEGGGHRVFLRSYPVNYREDPKKSTKMLICCLRHPSRYYSWSPYTQKPNAILLELNYLVSPFWTRLTQHGDLPTRHLYASFGLVFRHKYTLTAQSLPNFKYLVLASAAAFCDAAVQEYIRSLRRRRRRGRFSASISRGTTPSPPQHHQ